MSEQPLTDEAPGAAKLRTEAAENMGVIDDLEAVAQEHGRLTQEDHEVLNKWREEDVAQKLDQATEKDNKRRELLAHKAGEVADKAAIHTDKFGNILTPSEVSDIQSGNASAKK
jgi:molybdopterin-guanine dinucleotide biosynthesis protein A